MHYPDVQITQLGLVTSSSPGSPYLKRVCRDSGGRFPEIITGFLRFANAVLAHIDSVNRLSYVVPAAKILDIGHMAWCTRAEYARSPNSVTMKLFGDGAREPVHLAPPHSTRSALRLNVAELVDDLTIKLRRQLQNPTRN